MADNGTHKLSLVGLTKQYAQGIAPAVDRLDMHVEEGHLVSLLGPSGCGKTTTLRMVAGLMDPTAGQIMVDGADITNTPVHKRGMGMVFQSYALFPHMNVHENVAFGLQMRKKPKQEQDRLVHRALEMVQLEHLAKRQTRALSGGQQQRIALARALVVEPTLLLLDEPLSNLDAKLRETMRAEIRQIQQRTGATTLFVTHDQDEALDMSDRIAVMNGGLIEQFGSPIEVYERPRTRFVANFIGRANLLTVTIVDEQRQSGADSRYRVDVPGFGVHPAIGSPGLTGRRTLLIRPHRLGAEPAAAAAGLRGTIESLSYTGDSLSYRVRVGETSFTAERLTSGTDRMSVGDAAIISWRPEDALVLPEPVEDAAP
ncbi:ABC transporter ATP-binding protein [Microbacterium halophytorum]|uniref:ABC transporter ATP-binding protein n=1 Tax=Microbacterium halophytorum TaxID=2067568 RepID=UPI001E63367D|nr:ABC transporter ATP-binding protein [Microbacterium halophytorum]